MGSAPKPPRLVTKAEYDKAVADWTAANQPPDDLSGKLGKKSDISKALAGDPVSVQDFKDTMQVLPPPTPDLADEAVQKARQAARRKILMGGMTGPLDLTNGGAKALPGLSGV